MVSIGEDARATMFVALALGTALLIAQSISECFPAKSHFVEVNVD
jgi:hypothetical protein